MRELPAVVDNADAQYDERAQLVALVEAQQHEIEALRARIAALDPDAKHSLHEHGGDIHDSDRSETVGSLGPAQGHHDGTKEYFDQDVTKIAAVLDKVIDDPSVTLSFAALVKGLTTAEDVRNVRNICRDINLDAWEEIFAAFYNQVVVAAEKRPAHLQRRDEMLAPDWFHDPWYCAYVQYLGTDGPDDVAGFDNLADMLPYIRELGFRNLYILPHYESPMGDGGYDVSDYSPSTTLGGSDAFARFMNAATKAGVCVATDAIFNHTSTEHRWFQAALQGDDTFISYYVQRNGREKIAEYDRDGDIVCRYRDPDGTITERVCVFPDVDRTHGLWVEISGKTYQFYREFYPFQVDLNLQNPAVLNEIFSILAHEVNLGVLGKRMDAIAHWIKRPGVASDGLPESHAVHALIKAFVRHVCRKAIVIPEVVRSLETVSEYAGVATTINGTKCASEGDALLSFEMQAALREMTYFQTVAPFWQRIFRTPKLPSGSVWMNLLEHHDETYIGFFAPEVRYWICEYIKSHGGVVYKNGMSAGGRYADCLDHDPARIATALFLLYLTPGAPIVYAGLEIGWGNNHSHADDAQKRSHKKFQDLGVYVSEKACYDPRELQRGPLPRSAFTGAASNEFLPLVTVRALNDLRITRPSFRTSDVHPIDSGDIGVLCLARECHEQDKPLLCIANLTPFEKEVIMPVWQVQQRLHVDNIEANGVMHMEDLLSGTKLHVKRDHTSFRLPLRRFDRYVLQIESSSSA